jgi:glyoxylase-like metal-dependent hydrolase (beta-lactamase superfamily II)
LHPFDGNFSIHKDEGEFIKMADSFAAVCYMNGSEIWKRPFNGWKPSDYKLRPAQPPRLLTDGDVIDLGNRKFQVLHLPGHSRGSIAQWDEANGDLVSGDVAGNFPVLDWLPYGSVEDMIEIMERAFRD